MIDQDNAEIAALKNTQLTPILCIFHLMKTLLHHIKKEPQIHHSPLLSKIKAIQRSGKSKQLPDTQICIDDLLNYW